MATLKFKAKSPFEENDGRRHDVTDYKYQNYTENVSAQNKTGAPVNVAIFGLGRAGSIHLANIKANPRVNLKYIVEANTSIWDNITQHWNLKGVTFVEPKDADIVYNDENLQACFICTPTFTHEEFILGSLQGGKAVFGEKPISQDPDGTKRCYEKAAEVGKPLFCAFNRRFDPSFSSVQQKVRQGVLGHVQRVKTVSRFAAYGYDQRLEVFGHSGMLDVKNDSPNKTEYSGVGETVEAPMYYSFPSRHQDGYKRELDHFLDVIQKGEKMSVTDRMTAAVSKVADACEESAKSGAPVKLSWTPEEIPEDYVML